MRRCFALGSACVFQSDVLLLTFTYFSQLRALYVSKAKVVLFLFYLHVNRSFKVKEPFSPSGLFSIFKAGSRTLLAGCEASTDSLLCLFPQLPVAPRSPSGSQCGSSGASSLTTRSPLKTLKEQQVRSWSWSGPSLPSSSWLPTPPTWLPS